MANHPVKPRAIQKLLIANRGEIALRIIRAARELGIRSVLAHSSADADSLAARLADECISIGPPKASESYLNIEAIMLAAEKSGADAIHPGYGFLAENAEFAAKVEASGIVFIGPKAKTILLMGNKAAALKAAAAFGMPIIPGSYIPGSYIPGSFIPGSFESGQREKSSSLKSNSLESNFLLEQAERIGFPVMIKASAGGGGRGIRIARHAQEFKILAQQAAMEAKSAFGDEGLYLEKYLEHARHIEVQIIGDGEHVIHGFERECSLQRRRQKIWEEAPAPRLSEESRQKLCMMAASFSKSIGYSGAGTLEFLYDEPNNEFYFIEMNTRIQVEHPVTEAVTGLDLVREMINVAAGNPLSLKQEDISLKGHAIEVRLNAEDPSRNFMPYPGIIKSLEVPGGPGVRFDHCLYPGYAVPPFYDSLLGKLIVWDASREQALRRLQGALSELSITGIKTTAALFQLLSESKEVQLAKVHTQWLEPWLEKNINQLKKLID